MGESSTKSVKLALISLATIEVLNLNDFLHQKILPEFFRNSKILAMRLNQIGISHKFNLGDYFSIPENIVGSSEFDVQIYG